MKCRKGRWIVRYGDMVEVNSRQGGRILASFRSPADMCPESLKVYLAVRHEVAGEYKIRKLN